MKQYVCDRHPRRTQHGEYHLTPFYVFDYHGVKHTQHYCNACVESFLDHPETNTPLVLKHDPDNELHGKDKWVRIFEFEPGMLLLGRALSYSWHDRPCDLGCGHSVEEHEEKGWTYVLPAEHEEAAEELREGSRSLPRGRPRPDFDMHLDYPERFKDGPI